METDKNKSKKKNIAGLILAQNHYQILSILPLAMNMG